MHTNIGYGRKHTLHHVYHTLHNCSISHKKICSKILNFTDSQLYSKILNVLGVPKVCAVSFPQCTPSPPLHASALGPFDVEHAIYGTKLHPTIYVNYTIIKTCRGVCFDVYRKCPYSVGFTV